MNGNNRIYRPMLKADAKRNFLRNWRVLVLSCVIITALELILQQLSEHFQPQFTITIPNSILGDSDAVYEFLQSYMDDLYASITSKSIAITVILAIVNILVLTPATYGFYQTCAKCVRGETPNIHVMLGWFTDGRKIRRSIGLHLVNNIFVALWTLLFMIVPTGFLLLMTFCVSSLNFGLWYTIMLVYMVLVLCAVIAAIIINGRYTAATHVFAMNPELTVRQALRQGKQAIKGRYLEFFLFQLSFILWRILASVTFGIAGLFVTPYLHLSTIMFFMIARGEEIPPVVPPVDPNPPM